jgi:hypothetical protein
MPILIIVPVAFKQNLPIFIGFWLVVAGLMALVFFVQRPDEDLLRDAAANYAATLGHVNEVRVNGDVADIEIAGRPTLFARFEKRNGTWTFSGDLGAEFERTMKDPATEKEILDRLGQRLADTFREKVKLNEGLRYDYRLGRLPDGLQGEVVLHFAYPKQGEKQPLGMYREMYHYADGKWQSQGPGSLYNQLPPRTR